MPIDSSSKLVLVALFLVSQYVTGIARLLSWLVKCTICSYLSHSHIYKNPRKKKIHIHREKVSNVTSDVTVHVLACRLEVWEDSRAVTMPVVL